ncbi:MAG: hypothetical protein RRC07_12645 [Anaerolineae bacterium]|nr:hypothetical protein [Anaerolineae bacterium]
MTNKAAVHTGQGYGWQLLGEFTRGAPASGEQLVAEVARALEALNMQAPQLEQIRTALLKTVRRASRAGKTTALQAMGIRVWFLSSCVYDCGWGFFVVEKQSYEPRGSPAAEEPVYRIELFLYQERES